MQQANSQASMATMHVLLLAGVLALGLAINSQAAGPASVALVTEAAGKVETRVDEQTVPVGLLTELISGARVRLYKDARLVVLFFGTADQYALTGPSLVRITETGVEALSGNEPVKQQPLNGRNGKPLLLRPTGITQAGIVVRGIAKPIVPLSMDGAITLDARPVFRWREPEAGLEYRFLLRDGSDALIFERRLRDPTLALPNELNLQDGQRYRWSVTATSPAGGEYALSHRFMVADAQTREQVANFQPLPDAGTAQRIAYAIWLEQTGLSDEAKRQWRQLADERTPVPPGKLSQ